MNKIIIIIFLLILIPVTICPNGSWVNHINRHDLKGLLIEGQYLWMITSNTGLIRWNTTTSEYQIFDSGTGFFSDNDFHLESGLSGNVWIASGNVLASFENDKWKLHNSFQSRIIDFTVDHTGNLWIAFSDKIIMQNGDSFKQITAFDSLRELNQYVNEIVSGYMDSCVYVRVENRVFQFNTDGKHCKTIDIPLDDPWNIAVSKGELFVTAIDEIGIYKDGNWRFFSTDSSTLSSIVLDFSVSAQGDIWAYGQDLMVFENEQWVIKHAHERGDIRIGAVAPVNRNIAWVGGAFYFGKLIWGELQQIIDNTPADNSINYIYSDREGTIWAQCRNVLSRFSEGKWTHPFTRGTKGMVCTQDSVYYFIEEDNVLVYGRIVNGIRENNLTVNEFIPPGKINAISTDEYGKIWFATSEGIIQNTTDTLYSSKNCGFASSHINAILSIPDSTIWIGGNNGTLAYFKNGTWNVRNLEQSHNITALAFDSSGVLWIGTNNGIFTIANRWDNLIAAKKDFQLLNISSIIIDFNNRIWVGTNEGLGCYENGSWIIFRRNEGLTSNVITSLELGTDSVLWIGTYDRGISTLDLKSVSSRKRICEKKYGVNSDQRSLKCLILFKNKKPVIKNSCVYLLNGCKTWSSFNGRPTSNLYIFNSGEKQLNK